MVRHIFITTVFLVTFSAVSQADELQICRLATEGLAGWKSKIFKGSTDYHLVQDNGRTVILAHSRGTASGNK